MSRLTSDLNGEDLINREVEVVLVEQEDLLNREVGWLWRPYKMLMTFGTSADSPPCLYSPDNNRYPTTTKIELHMIRDFVPYFTITE